MPQIRNLKNSIFLPLKLSQLIGILSWVISWCLNPSIERSLDIFIYCALAGATLSIIVTSNSRSMTTWRLFGILYMTSLTFLFKVQIERMGVEASMWGLVVTSLLITGMSVFFVKFIDYMVAAALIWLIMWQMDLTAVGVNHASLFYVFLISSTLLGGCLNATFLSLVMQTMSARDRYQELSETDTLTHAPNRRALVANVNKALASADKPSLWFAMLDLDNFKNINDTHGHDAGDNVLVSFAALIKSTPGLNSFGRLGGEEFGVLLSAATAADAIDALDHLLMRAQHDETADVPYSFSGGIASLKHAENINDLFKEADENLYHAKRNGRKCIAFEGRIISATALTAAHQNQPSVNTPTPA
ncbi:GGDEF domain-containing protein [Pseudomonas syringae pv. tagetis]|uniref:diguanylate cyclase n=2 Tax=Pseudomonas syringae group genomosp. 7 TaxID=251699 RepID=A0A0Q0C6N6_9PSED|nr:GGDEF domain-containing protein [Pseudomonas syringae group genomosp. 7]KPX39620.1 GGDEF domain-containing protein [Pseudomonas syringae pv. helianthi]KPY82965.1 GGDEF domain-containing protein [Pseudomonas syringae pv. tagetis]RMV47744.1 GGDEF domain-containing protein [Pseudomonas syringae pv. helianthi]RMW19535.1 GGDEF domain-containing protein [Pseudomonas syringae pv. tagetis]RMW21801.1 GGDEF domain-containing protein [Pseudomonas syringae pv. tagetis]